MAKTDKTPIATEAAPAAIGPYCQAMRVGELVFTSGQIALRPDGSFVDGDVRDQARQVLDNLGAVLDAAGSSLAQVVKCTVFLADMDDFAAVNEVYGSYFGEEPPARSTVQVARLPKDARVEIECIAIADG